MRSGKTDNLAWGLAWTSMGLCLASKESVRFTALWHFDAKPLSLVVVLGVLFLIVFAVIARVSAKRPLVLYAWKPVVLGLAVVQAVGMAMHVLEAAGAALPDGVVAASYVGMEASIIVLLMVSQYLYSFKSEQVLSCFVYGIFVAGTVQILLVFFNVVLARWLACLLCLLATILLCVSVSQRGSASACPQAMCDSSVDDERSYQMIHGKELHGYKTCVWMIFLVSLVIMGVYAQWQSQQDGATASILIQVCSGLGLVAAAAFFAIARKYLTTASLLFLCQAIVLPITLGALYLGAIFQGAGVSFSVLLFDLAYGLILFCVWLMPFVYRGVGVLRAITMGFLAHKMGWALGLCLTRAFPWPDLQWVGTGVIVLAFLALIVLSGVSIAQSRHDSDKTVGESKTNGLAEACRIVGDAYRLTEREREVLLMLAKGRTASYLARDLVLSESTVRTHIMHIYRKTGVNSQQELIDEIEKIESELASAETGEAKPAR